MHINTVLRMYMYMYILPMYHVVMELQFLYRNLKGFFGSFGYFGTNLDQNCAYMRGRCAYKRGNL